MRTQYILATLFLLIHLSESGAQQEVFQFEHITVEEGLSQRTVRGIEQDRFGFMWFATHDGLNKYDGIQFIHFTPESHPAMQSSTIYNLLSEENGDIWICTGKGVCLY